MPGFALLPLRVALVAGLLLTAGASALSAQERVGVNSAVNPEATGAVPGATVRRLVIGQDVVFNEHITTAETGQTQLLFLDESSMAVGPNSDLTIDQFVYDPRSGTGKLAMSATRGLLRYVGGKLSKQDEAVTLRTSTATLAVRGGAFIARIGPDGRTDAVFLHGKSLTITGVAGGSQIVTRPGFFSTINPGGPPSPPAALPPGLLAQFIQQLDGRTGVAGGARNVPTDANVVDSGISQTISGNPVQGPQARGQGGPINPSLAAMAINSQLNSVSLASRRVIITFAGRFKETAGKGTARGFVDRNGDVAYSSGTLRDGVFTASANGGSISFPLVPGSSKFGPQGTSFVSTTSNGMQTFTGTSFLSADNTFFYADLTPTNLPTERAFIFGGTPVSSTALQSTGSTRVFAFTVQPDAALQSNIPFIRAQDGGNLPNASVSPLYLVAPATTKIGDATTLAATRGLQASLAIDGQGPTQKSTIAVTTGTVGSLQSDSQPIFDGRLRGSSLQSATGTPVALDSHVTSTVDGAGNSIYGGSTISGFVLDQSNATATAPGSGIVASVTPSTASENKLTVSGTGTDYGFTQPAVSTSVPSGVGTSRTTQTLTGSFGGLMTTTAQTTPYIVTGDTSISTNASTNRIQATLTGTAQSSASAGVTDLTMQFGALTGNAAGKEAFIDNNTFAVLESQVNPQQINGKDLVVDGDTSQAGKLYLASSGAAGTSSSVLPSGVSYCDCNFLQWGYWGGDLQTGNSSDSSISRIDRGHINFWVAGVPTPLGDLNTLASQSATGTYSGHAIGSVFNQGASYVAVGSFLGTYNFGPQTGTLTISNFDKQTFSTGTTPVKLPLTGANYTFNLASSSLTGTVNGTFYGPKAAETGGNFSVQSVAGLPTYLASGIFAGRK